jgi:succinate dehydrogenase hydrophobic anchor subunit
MEENGLPPSWLYITIISALSFKVVNRSAASVLPPPQKFRDQWKKVWLWENICTSFVHSVVSAALAVYRYILLQLKRTCLQIEVNVVLNCLVF